MADSLLTRITAAYNALANGGEKRSYVLKDVDQTSLYFGHQHQFTPPEYVEYLSTSNGVYTAATLRANLLASLPLRLYKTAKGDRVEVTAGRLRDLLSSVNPFWTWERLIRMTELSLCIWGQAFWFLERGNSGKGLPQQIWWGRGDRVTIVPHETGYIAGYLYDPVYGGTPIRFAPGEVIWMAHPNLVDEFAGLSPLAAARLAADTASAAMKSNRNIFENGMAMGGIVVPKSGTVFSDQQARELSESLERRFKGVDKAHRWGVFRDEVQVQELGVTPHDAEFMDALRWSLEDISRAYHIPIDLLGGQRTYENLEASLRAVWTLALIPEARFIASELTEKLLPMFGGEADEAVFDHSDIDALQEGKTEKWTRQHEQLAAGVITINEWRQGEGLKPVAWGDEPLLSAGLAPVSRILEPPMPEPIPQPAAAEPAAPLPAAEPATRAAAARPVIRQTAPAYGSDEHRAILTRAGDAAAPIEKRFIRKLKPLFEKQRDAVIKNLTGSRSRAEGDALTPFDPAEWEKIFSTEMLPLYVEAMGLFGQAAIDELALRLAFDLSAAEVQAFLVAMVQRFAERVNETTWTLLKGSLSAGVAAGETITQLETRVFDVMLDRIRSSAETIARTETQTAYTGSQLAAWRQTGVVEKKSWLAALDDRTRDSHREAHGQTVGLNEPFTVGGATGDGPGLMGAAEEDINCRCTTIAVLEDTPRAVNGYLKRLNLNGKHKVVV